MSALVAKSLLYNNDLGQKSSTSVAGDDAFSKIDTLRKYKYDTYNISDDTTSDIKVALSNKWNSLTTGMWVIRTSAYTFNCFIYKHDGGNSYGTALVMSYTGSLSFVTRQNGSMNWYTISTKLAN